MIHSSKLNITYANKGKKEKLDLLFEECKRVINLAIDELWKMNGLPKFYSISCDTWLGNTMKQAMGKQALEIVKKLRKLKSKKKGKPNFNKDSLVLDQRFIDFYFDEDTKSFDVWIKLSTVGNKIVIILPSHKHSHFLKYYKKWNMKKTITLRKIQDQYFIICFFETENPKLKDSGSEIGLDIGYKKLVIDSNGQVYDEGLESTYEKIARKKQGSKGFKRALKERDNKINQSLNKIDFDNIKTIVVEDLKNVKYKTKGKFRKSFNNKLQRWSYPKVLNKLSLVCEEKGINLVRIDPSYTSQTCSKCGVVDKNSRHGEQFLCTTCGMSMDADHNAAINILHRGAYSPSAEKTCGMLLYINDHSFVNIPSCDYRKTFTVPLDSSANVFEI